MTERYSYIPMPIDATGNGPADPDKTVRTLHQVWRMSDNTTECSCRDEATARHVARLMNKAAALTPRTLLELINVHNLADHERLIVHAQNPANHHYWTKQVGKFTAGEVRAALRNVDA